MAKKSISLNLPKALIKSLQAKADSEAISLAALVERLCRQGLEGATQPNNHSLPATALDRAVETRIAATIAPLALQIVALEKALEEVRNLIPARQNHSASTLDQVEIDPDSAAQLSSSKALASHSPASVIASSTLDEEEYEDEPDEILYDFLS